MGAGMKRFGVVATVLVAGVLVAGFAVSAHAGEKAPHWTYEGETGPAAWGKLAPEFAVCASGQSQSPINIAESEGAEMSPIQLRYRVSPLDVIHNSFTVQVNVAPGSSAVINGREYRLIQYHFHTPSEHLVDGRTYPMEIHFVHKNDAGDLAVISVMAEPGEANLAAQEIWDHLPTKADTQTKQERILVNGRDLMPEAMSYYRYMGSLTEPPCSEGVNWFVLKSPVQFSNEQIKQIEGAMGRNARPVQERRNRIVLGSLGSKAAK